MIITAILMKMAFFIYCVVNMSYSNINAREK